MKMARIWAVAAVLVVLGLAGPASALTLTWNVCEGGSDSLCLGWYPESPRSASGSGVDQVFSFATIEDLTQPLLARAFVTASALGTGVVAKRQINIFDGGLGAGPEGSPEHAVDNRGPDEFIVFQLPGDGSKPISFRIGYFSTDADISTWIGGTLGGQDDALSLLLSGSFVWSASGGALTSVHGYVQQEFTDVGVGTNLLFTGNATGRYLVVGTRHEASGSSDGGEDAVKLLQIVADESPATRVPFPGTLVLVALGVLALAVIAGRQRG